MFVVGDIVRVIKTAPRTGECKEQLGLVGTVVDIDYYTIINQPAEIIVEFDTPFLWNGYPVEKLYYYEDQLEPAELEDYEICLV